MEDLKQLTISLKYDEFSTFDMDLNQKIALRMDLLQKAFDREEVINNMDLNRLTFINAELLILQDEQLLSFFNKDEVDELVKRLTDEEQQLRALLEIKNEKAKRGSNKFSKFDQRLNLLKELNQV